MEDMTNVNPQERPAGLPDNFQSVEALAQSYKELQGRFTQQQQQRAQDPVGIPQHQQPASQEPQRQQAPQSPLGIHTPDPKGLGLEEYVSQFSQEWANGNRLSENSYARIQQEKGLNRQEVDSYIQGRVALNNQIEQAGYAAAGGPDNYKQLQNWAAQKLQPHEISAYNEVMASGNPFLVQNMVTAMRTRMAQETGNPDLVQNAPGTFSVMNAGDLTPYPSEKEAQDDMDKDEYATDAAFRRRVIQRMAISPWTYEDPRRPGRDRNTFLDGALKDIQL